MLNDHVVHALVRKYAELAGQLQRLDQDRARVADELDHVRATVLLFQPGYRIKAIAPRRPKKPSRFGHRGALMRIVMDTLRQSAGALSAREIAGHVLAARGALEPDDNRLKLTIRAVNISLVSLEKRGTATSNGEVPRRWSLASA